MQRRHSVDIRTSVSFFYYIFQHKMLSNWFLNVWGFCFSLIMSGRQIWLICRVSCEADAPHNAWFLKGLERISWTMWKCSIISLDWGILGACCNELMVQESEKKVFFRQNIQIRGVWMDPKLSWRQIKTFWLQVKCLCHAICYHNCLNNVSSAVMFTSVFSGL